MGTFHYPVAVGPKNSPQRQRVIALVDTTSTYASMPGSLLNMLGVTPEWTNVFELADGRQEECSLAEVRLSIDGQERTTICVFGKPESQPIVGSHALLGFGLAADYANRKLTPARLCLARMAGTNKLSQYPAP